MNRLSVRCIAFSVLLSVAAFSPGPAAQVLEVSRETLKNGMRVVVIRNTLAPVVTAEMNYLVGSNEAPEGFPGTAHAQEHMMFRGSKGLSESQLANILAGMGGKFDADIESLINAEKTKSTFAVVYGCSPSNVAQARAIAENALHQMQTTPVTHEELQQARTLLVRKVPLSESSVSDIASLFLELSKLNLPLDEQVLAAKRCLKITAVEVQEAYAKWIRPDDFVQVVLGPAPK